MRRVVARENAHVEPVMEYPIDESPSGVFDTGRSAVHTMRVGGTIILPASSEATAEMLRGRGYDVRTVDISELMKAEGSLTCMRQLFTRQTVPSETKRPGRSRKIARA